MQPLDELVTAPSQALGRAAKELGRVVEDGIGAAVEYELFRRNSRRELPPLARHSSNPVVARVAALLDGARPSAKNLQLQPLPFDVMMIPGSLGAEPEWMAFRKRLELSARSVGFADAVAAGMAGAVAELADNVVRHSERAETGLAGFACGSDRFEYVVADAGIGMLASLRCAHEFQSLRDDMEALPLAVTAGISRLGRDVGYGYGYRAVFAPLRAANGVVRLRSGAAVLVMAGRGPTSDRGVCSQRPFHQGVTVSVAVSPQ